MCSLVIYINDISLPWWPWVRSQLVTAYRSQKNRELNLAEFLISTLHVRCDLPQQGGPQPQGAGQRQGAAVQGQLHPDL